MVPVIFGIGLVLLNDQPRSGASDAVRRLLCIVAMGPQCSLDLPDGCRELVGIAWQHSQNLRCPLAMLGLPWLGCDHRRRIHECCAVRHSERVYVRSSRKTSNSGAEWSLSNDALPGGGIGLYRCYIEGGHERTFPGLNNFPPKESCHNVGVPPSFSDAKLLDGVSSRRGIDHRSFAITRPHRSPLGGREAANKVGQCNVGFREAQEAVRARPTEVQCGRLEMSLPKDIVPPIDVGRDGSTQNKERRRALRPAAD